MNMTEIVIKDLKKLIRSKGYIYALCMILFEDFHINPETIHEIDHTKRLSIKEVSLLLGFLIQNEISFATPDSLNDLIHLKRNTYDLMENLQLSYQVSFNETLQNSPKKEHHIENYREEKKEFFGRGDFLTEAIFYSGTGAYDFQYLEFLDKKYKYDKEWLFGKKKFNIGQTQKIAIEIKKILQEKSKKIHLYALKEKLPQIVEEMRKKNPNTDWENHAKEASSVMEFHQYVELFFEDAIDKKNITMEDSWNSFYKGLIELFIIRSSDFNNNNGIKSFLNNFSISVKKHQNSQFKTIGNYNIINSHPIIKLDEERYFVTNTFLLFEAIYESPFYWMIQDNEYKDQAGKNRGQVGEEIVFESLAKVFENKKIFKSLKITTKKGYDDTDIDVLCILGSKALCVQVKSKKLTELSRTGNDTQLQKDFQGAVQDAYKQGLVSRNKILKKKAKFIDENNNEIVLSEEIDEVYIMAITTENYPSLTHQANILLEKKDDDPFPIVLTIFDLELLIHYLNDPYDFLYYIKQRTELIEYFIADEEMGLLGYHLDRTLWKIPKVDRIYIDPKFAKLIDRNYYPIKSGLRVSDDGDAIKKRWKNEYFDKLCDQLKTLNQAKVTDILFYLFEWNKDAISDLVNSIVKTKQKTLLDGKIHNFSIPPDYNYSPRVGVTYFTLNSDNVEELEKRLLTLCHVRKYKSKGDVWIGFGSLQNSHMMIDSVAFNDQKWEYDKELEKVSKIMLDGKGQKKYLRGNKIGRNEKCPCGSNLKYKKCCGR